MQTSIIAAMGQNCVIGDDRGLPWHLPADLRRFRDLTVGKPVIMGRKTLELIGKPLPGRHNIVLTRQADYTRPGILVAHSMSEALEIARSLLPANGKGEAMVIGGAEVYRQALALADRIYLTIVMGTFPGSATFPLEEMAGMGWDLANETHVDADAKNPYPHVFYTLDRLRDRGRSGSAVKAARLLAG